MIVRFASLEIGPRTTSLTIQGRHTKETKETRKGYLLPGLFCLYRYKKQIDQVRIIVLGVVRERLKTGAGGMLFYETAVRAVKMGYPHGEASWVLEDNVMMNRGAEMMNGDRYKTYRIYESPLP